uniref:PAS domain-containing protein n=1 Tax=Pseudomonas phage HRDY3 TaxID=3236930 RepID=A0AB39CEF7_9VIRU
MKDHLDIYHDIAGSLLAPDDVAPPYIFCWEILGHPTVCEVLNRREIHAGLNPPPLIRMEMVLHDRISFEPIRLRVHTVDDLENRRPVPIFGLVMALRVKMQESMTAWEKYHGPDPMYCIRPLMHRLDGQLFYVQSYEEISLNSEFEFNLSIVPYFGKLDDQS